MRRAGGLFPSSLLSSSTLECHCMAFQVQFGGGEHSNDKEDASVIGGCGCVGGGDCVGG